MCELHISTRVKKKKRMREKKSSPRNTHVCGWQRLMIVCKRTAHSWSVLCPSFFPSTLPARRFTHTLPPTSSALLFAFFFFFYSHAFVHLFSPFSFLSFSLLCMCEHFVLSSLLCDLTVEHDVEKVYHYCRFQSKETTEKEDGMLV